MKGFLNGLSFFHLQINFAEMPTISLNFNHEFKDKVKISPKLRKDIEPPELALKFLPTPAFQCINQLHQIMRLVAELCKEHSALAHHPK